MSFEITRGQPDSDSFDELRRIFCKRTVDGVAVGCKMGLSMTVGAECHAVPNPIAIADTQDVMNVEESREVASFSTSFSLTRAQGAPQHGRANLWIARIARPCLLYLRASVPT